MLDDPSTAAAAEGGPTRRILIALVLISILGLLGELLLLEHFEDALQWIPLVLLAAALATTALFAARPSRGTIRAFQAVMALCLVAGAVGVFLHYRGNVEFELERDPSLGGLALFWEAIRGATPSLAPGAMAQLGLLGLATTYRHPALRSSFRPADTNATSRADQPRHGRDQ